MKSAIITFHRAINYGGILQLYALQEALISLDQDVTIIDYINSNVYDGYDLFPFKSILKNPKDVKGNFKLLISKTLFIGQNFRKKKKFKNFILKNFSMTEKTSNHYDLEKISDQFDNFICGSDQIWNTNITQEFDSAYFLDFVSDEKIKISYAASIGEKSSVKGYEREFKNAILKLTNFSVRENSSVPILEKISDRKAISVLDPTLIIDKEKFLKIREATNINEKYILVYTLEKNALLIKAVNELSKLKNMKVVHFARYKMFENELQRFGDAGPCEFIDLFYNAEYIITNSFHGTAFSILFDKKFLVIPHSNRGSRMVDLLTLVGLNALILTDINLLSNIDLKINRKNVVTKLNKEQKKALTFLSDSLNIE